MADRGQLQACKRCRTRKRTCDKAIPRCTICSKAKKPCIFVDISTGDEYTREQIAELEEREAGLRSGQRQQTQSEAPGHELSTDAPDAQAEIFVGDASGINILESVLGNPQFGPQLLRRLLVRPRIEQQKYSLLPCPFETQRRTFARLNSIRESHTQKPFLPSEEVHGALQRVYAEEPSDQDRFTLLMVCAIAAVALRRKGLISQHPYGFFLTARTLLNNINLRSGLPALKNLLLLARFAVYFHVGLSSWEIGRICIQLCIQMDLHRSPNKRSSASEEQQRRILFWESYILDRHCSTILGRPFAIADEEIDVALPINASPTTLQGLENGDLEQIVGTDLGAPEPVAVFIAFIKLRQLTSRIHTAFFGPKIKSCGLQTPNHKPMLLLGEQYSKYSQLSDELNQWRSSAPIFIHTETFYQSQEWYDFLLQKERLLLVRGIMAAMKSASPPDDLRKACCECAAEVIRLFGSMYWTQRINCTRHYFQILLIAGLLLAYHSPGSMNRNDTERLNVSQTARSLAACSNLLRSLGTQMLDALPYATIFNVICDSTFPDWSDYKQDSQQVGTSATEENHSTFQNQINQEISDLFDLQSSSCQPESRIPALDTFPGPDTRDPHYWIYSPGHLFADMESFVNQFATGDYTDDPMFGFLSWNMPFEDASTSN